jgi:preprotein translocase subunit SecG
MTSFLAWTSQVVLALLGIFLMIVILLQRGRGGGLAGAFGGMGGQSAFGTKAGDVFTRITIVIAILWVIVAGGSGFLLRAAADKAGAQFGEGQPSGVQLLNEEAIPEKKPAADQVPPRPEPTGGATSESPDSKSATPVESGAAPSAEPAATTSEPAPTEPATTPATTEPATPAPTDGAATPEQK